MTVDLRVPSGEISVADTAATPIDQLRRACAHSPDRMAIITRDRRLSFLGVEQLSTRVARGLRRDGVATGDRVALHLRNSEYLAAAYYACFAIGAIAVPINIRFKGAEASYVLRDSGSRIYFGDGELLDRISDRPGRIERWITLNGARPAAVTIEEWLPEAELADTVSCDPKLPAAVLYSSGTTSHPKGITHSQATLASAARLGGAMFSAHDVILIASAMVHAAGLLSLLSAMRLGASCVMADGIGDVALDTIERDRVTTMLALPSLYWAMVDGQRALRRDLESARCYMVCGDIPSPQLLAACDKQLGRSLRPHYGLTEVFPVTIGDVATEAAMLGAPIDGVRLRLVDEAGSEVTRGETGEIWVDAPSAMLGYWSPLSGSPEARGDAWVRTGDLARQGPGGEFYFQGRKKDVIICGGSNVAPAEVEHQLLFHPEITDVAVVGQPDQLLGESVAAYVVPRAGTNPEPSALQAFLADRLADYKIPKVITLVSELPRTSTGKLQRQALRRATPPQRNPIQ